MSDLSKFRRTLTEIGRLESHDLIREQALQLERSEHLDVLQDWQAQRLKLTYQDFLQSSRYGAACRFFLSEIYAAKDFRQRDHEIIHLYEIMSRFLPDFLLRLVTETIELYELTNELDEALLTALRQELGVTGSITPELYAEAYRVCDNYAERVRQIELIGEVGHMVEVSTKIPLVGTSLKLARLPAQATGWTDLHDFIERGFQSFKRMRGSEKFLQAIHDREMLILDRIYASHPQPFEPWLVSESPSE
jgi:hypothetical protein